MQSERTTDGVQPSSTQTYFEPLITVFHGLGIRSNEYEIPRGGDAEPLPIIAYFEREKDAARAIGIMLKEGARELTVTFDAVPHS